MRVVVNEFFTGISVTSIIASKFFSPTAGGVTTAVTPQFLTLKQIITSAYVKNSGLENNLL